MAAISNDESSIIFLKIVLFCISIKPVKHLVCCGHTLPKNVADITLPDSIEKSLYTNHLKSLQLIKIHISYVNHLFKHTIRLISLTNKANFAVKKISILNFLHTKSHFLKEICQFCNLPPPRAPLTLESVLSSPT